MKQLQALCITAAAVAAAFLAGRGLLAFWTRREAEAAYQAALVPIRVQRAQQWADFLGALLYVALAAAIVVVVGVLVGIALFVMRQRNLARAVPVGRDGLPAPMQYRLPDGTIVIFSPAMLPGPAAMIGPNGLQVLSDPSAAQMHQQNTRVQAAAALQLPEVGRMPNAATWAAMAGRYDPKPLPAPAPMLPAPVEAPAEPVRLLTAHSAVRESAPDRWIVGQNPQTGELAAFCPAQHAHAGIVGSTGTGKTSLGFMLVLEALSAGFGVTILDPDSGADWRQFAGVAEWHPTDAETFPDQIAALYAEYVRRRRNPGVDYQPRMVVLEEWGDMLRQLRGRSRNTAQRVGDMVDEMAGRARKTHLSLVFMDQYPAWSPAVIAGVKFIAAFRMGRNQGAKVAEWHAHNLAPVGEFMVPNGDGARFASFDTRGRLPSLLRSVPPSAAPRLIEGTARQLEAVPWPGNAGNAGNAPREREERADSRGREREEREEREERGTAVEAETHPPPTVPGTGNAGNVPPPAEVRDQIVDCITYLERTYGVRPTQAAVREEMRGRGWSEGDEHKSYVFRTWREYYGEAV